MLLSEPPEALITICGGCAGWQTDLALLAIAARCVTVCRSIKPEGARETSSPRYASSVDLFGSVFREEVQQRDSLFDDGSRA